MFLGNDFGQVAALKNICVVLDNVRANVLLVNACLVKVMVVITGYLFKCLFHHSTNPCHALCRNRNSLPFKTGRNG